MRKVTVTFQNNEYEYEVGTTYEKIAKDFQKDFEAKIVLVAVDGRLRELHKILSNDCTIEFITLSEKIGMETYRRSATFLLVKAVHDV
ncbi:MAG: nucleoside kinase, partial [Lachnospiraceae bacterium]|nr:nucleoside kinase [Lachnospiraceae bacterium]